METGSAILGRRDSAEIMGEDEITVTALRKGKVLLIEVPV